MSSKTLKRLVMLLALTLVVVTPVLVGAYLLDRNRDPGPTLAERKLTEAEAAVREHPDDIGLRLSLAAAYRANDRSPDASTQYEAILKVQPDNVAALLGQAAILEASGGIADAAGLYRTVIRVRAGGEFAIADADLQQAYYGLGAIAVQEERFAEAVTALESAVQIDRTDADAWYQLGLAQLGAGVPAKAVAAQRKAVTFIPTEWADPYAAMADAYTAMADRDHAEYARAMVDLVGMNYDAARDRLLPLVDGIAAQDASIGLGLVAEKTGKTADAISWYTKALELDPESIAASWGLSRMGVELAEASAAPGEVPSGAPSESPAGGNG